MQMQEGWSPAYELRGPRFGKLTISMAECEGLVFVTFAKFEKRPSELRGDSEGCDTRRRFLRLSFVSLMFEQTTILFLTMPYTCPIGWSLQ